MNDKHARFWGMHESVLQADASVIVPEKFRERLGEEVLMVHLPDHALGVYPQSVWKTWQSELERMLDIVRHTDARRILATAEFESVDPSGALFISETQCEWARLTPESPIIIIGAENRVEVWDRSEWEAYQAQIKIEP